MGGPHISAWDRDVGNVEPFLPPVLSGLELLQIEVLNVAAGLDPKASNSVDASAPGVALDIENALPKPPVRVYPEETLA